jgi:putative component of membrane protein insertase Oxa1/YidC/SpoIIIJ protein YidD
MTHRRKTTSNSIYKALRVQKCNIYLTHGKKKKKRTEKKRKKRKEKWEGSAGSHVSS